MQSIREIAKEIRHAKKNLPENSSERLGTPLSGEDFFGKFFSYPLFHTDASQAGMYLNLNINQLGVDLMTLDGQKIGGPKGVGALFVKAGVNISPIIFGGGQEKGLRSGTENIPLIVGLAKAFELARVIASPAKQSRKVKTIRDYFWQKIQKAIPTVVLNGNWENRLPNNLNFSIPGIDPEFTVLCLDEAGIVCSTKSACDRDEDESFVIRALGKSDDLVKSALRFSLNEDITRKDIDLAVKGLYNAKYGYRKTN